MTKDFKALILIGSLLLTFCAAFILPKASYESLDIIPTLNIPYTLGDWQGKDVKHDIKLMDERYNFIKALFLREYVHQGSQQTIYLYLLDAGNFHNPKVCFGATGAVIRDLESVPIPLEEDPFTAASFFINRKAMPGILVAYWITINGQRVAWVQQKLKELWFSLAGAKKAGLMIRVDTPANDAMLPAARAGVQDFFVALHKVVSVHDRKYIFGNSRDH